MEGAKLTNKDVECIVYSLKSFQVSEVGSTDFLDMAYNMQRLALHMQTDSAVVASILLLHDKMTVLVKNLLAVEAWRVFVLRDKLLPRVAAKNRVRCSFALHTERTLLALIDVVHLQGFDLAEETSISLIDYCARSMTWLLGSRTRTYAALPVQEHELDRTCRDSEYRCAVLASTSLARHFCESFEKLCLDAQTRILDTHDFPLLLVQLLEEPPWTRKRRVDSHVMWEKWIDDAWNVVPNQNLIQLTQNEGQCWISLFHLTCSDACRQRYGLTASRKKQLLRLKKLLNHDALVSQLGILTDIKQYLVALERLEVPLEESGGLIERVDVLRDELVRSKDWSSVATEQYVTIFIKVQDATDQDIQKFASLYMNNDFRLTQLQEGTHPSGNIGTVDIETQCGERLVTFHLSVKGEEKIMDTPEGEFLRSTLAVHCIDGEEEHLLIHPESKIRVTITTVGIDRLLQVDNLALPTMKEIESDIGSSITTPNELSSREWRQLGTVEDGLVMQLGFKCSSRAMVGDDHDVYCYVLDKAFIAQRHG
jgi:hypothetical protein